MTPEQIAGLANLSGADPMQLYLDIEKYGLRDFFARMDFLDYPENVKEKLDSFYRVLLAIERGK